MLLSSGFVKLSKLVCLGHVHRTRNFPRTLSRSFTLHNQHEVHHEDNKCCTSIQSTTLARLRLERSCRALALWRRRFGDWRSLRCLRCLRGKRRGWEDVVALRALGHKRHAVRGERTVREQQCDSWRDVTAVPREPRLRQVEVPIHRVVCAVLAENLELHVSPGETVDETGRDHTAAAVSVDHVLLKWVLNSPSEANSPRDDFS